MSLRRTPHTVRTPARCLGIGLLVCITCWIGCGKPSDNQSKSPGSGATIRVIATTGMVADLVRAVGGERVDVVQVIGAGVDPHLYNPSRDDVALIMSGDVIFYSGLMLEGKLADTLGQVGRSKPVFAVTERIDKEYLLLPDDAAGHADPHVWMDASAWSQCVDVISEALVEFSAKDAETFRQNAAAYQSELEELHQYAKKTLATIPRKSRVMITSHDAFNYFGRAYDLEVLGVQGLSTESEAGLQQINELVDLLVQRKVRAVFTESSVSPKNIKALIEGAAAQGFEIKLGGVLFSDAMGPQGTYEGTYVGMLDHNVTTVARALGGQAPESGMHGKLNSVKEHPSS
ncbi:metal ABC transporter solute-binding protein, Zn/Mn family [Crateriforma conspicua]|uniref:metal ABC transporter solute-binding protein, Zn/Mn family n=1 Tax=Crateriforma conspicua TaxID=2527996 RepID=UPI00118C1742|nr:zinc ABC transporter substrate-binding protein [Crateriforma conspicua]QDV63865.1 Periplasmic zinc-binding protein TroA precursor [Crateriforma conspicua]